MPADTLLLRVPAKINLFLEVLDKRPDGYHGVRSVIAPISLFDRITLVGTDGAITSGVAGEQVPPEERERLSRPDRNLAARAAAALREATGYRGGVHIEIEKGIPISAGLGGGSADAAAVLRGLNRLWETGLPLSRLLEIGRTLGSDVPALVHGGMVLIEGTGERVTPVRVDPARSSRPWWVVIANPGFGVSTRDICSRYRSPLTTDPSRRMSMVSAVASWDLAAAAGLLFNSLDRTVCRKYPLLAMLAEEMRAAGALGALLSGSGASVFALAESESRAHDIAAAVPRAMGTRLWTRVATVLPDGVTVAHGPLEARV